MMNTPSNPDVSTAVAGNKNTITNPNARVRTAIENTPAEYWQACLEMRSDSSEKAAGSRYHGTPALLDRAIKSLEWEPYTHEAVKEPAVAFIATHFGGTFGMLMTEHLEKTSEIRLEDPKSTGWLEGRVLLTDEQKENLRSSRVLLVDFTVIILGPDEGKEVVYTFHPGDPIPPSRVPSTLVGPGPRKDTTITPAKALELGLTWVKL